MEMPAITTIAATATAMIICVVLISDQFMIGLQFLLNSLARIPEPPRVDCAKQRLVMVS
jgi:hypothetical protein